MCPKEFFDWTSFSMNLSRFVTIFRLWAECSVKLLQKLERSCQKCLLLEQQNFSRKLCFLKKKFTFTIFSSFDVKLRRLLSENLPPGLKNCFLHSFKGSSCITLSFSSRNFTPTNGLWGEKIGIFSKIFFDMVVKSVFFVCRGHFWRNHFLFHKISKFFSCFQTLRKTFRIFGENILVGLSKLFSSVQGIFLEEFNFENEFLEFLLYFWSSGTNLLDFRRKFSDRFVKTPFYVSSGDFWLDCFFYEYFWNFPPSSGYEELFLAFWRKNFKKFVRTAIYV